MSQASVALEPWKNRLTGRTGRTFWRAIEEVVDEPGFQAAIAAEFPSAFAGLADVERRGVLKALAASLGLSLAACSAQGDPEALPYVTAPDADSEGLTSVYATAVLAAGYVQPVLGVTHAGRPIKLEGQPAHPLCRGATDAYTQAALLGLYDPDRTRGPERLGRPAAWSELESVLVETGRRLDLSHGRGLRILTGAQTSPTFARQLDAILARWPEARWHAFEPADREPALEASRQAFGEPLRPHLDLAAAETIVCLDHDVFEPGPEQVRHAREWSARRQAFQAGRGRAVLHVAEPTPSLTGAMAADRLIAAHERIAALALGLARAMDLADGLGSLAPTPPLNPRETQWIARAAADLRAAGPAALVSVGPHHAPELQALGLRLTAQLGGVGHGLTLRPPARLAPPDGERSLEVLAADMARGAVDVLVVMDANPVYAAPADLAFAAAMARVPLRVHAGLHRDETARLCHWHAPLQHDLETWSDGRDSEGRVSLLQPLVRPFYDVRSRHVFLQNLLGDLGTDPLAPVATTWRQAWGEAFDARWRAALVRGFVDELPPPTPVEVVAKPLDLQGSEPPRNGVSVLFRPDPSVWDGRFANNAWLQELPKPLNKVTWDNVIAVSPALAKASGLANGDEIRIEAGGRALEGPVWITPGQERQSVTVFLGYGRRLPGQLGDGHGYDAYALRAARSPWRLDGARLSPTGRKIALASTQPHTALQGFDFVRTVPPEMAAAQGAPKAAQPSYFGVAHEAQAGPSWGMSIDTDLCIGCNACVTACDAENNIPMVGKDQVAKGREMHWLRIDHYHEGPPDDPRTFFQPVPCMHCEAAPCEMGCPVNATVHSPEGLNLQVYNRCIGTRTCSSFCPYKVRRFNWFDYTAGDPPERQAARNPQVSVRSRGVMEKCTYCIQRISQARIDAKKDGRPIAEGEVKTACQQACPTDAIVFGDVSAPGSAVSRRKALARDYTLLEEANTRPRTTYLARIDPHPARDDGEEG